MQLSFGLHRRGHGPGTRRRFYRFSSVQEALGPDDRPPTPAQVHGMTITDSLIASLAEPNPKTPIEQSPTHTERPR